MGWRLHRSIKVLPGVRLNLSKSGLGLSVGPRGLKVGMDSKGRAYTSAGIPGTGLSSRRYLGRPGAALSPSPRTTQRQSIGTFGAVLLAGALLTVAVIVAFVLVAK